MKIFNINNVQSRTQIRARQNQTTGVQTEQKLERRFLKEMTKPEMDTVSFKGNIVHGINSSKKWVDYGDIFKEGADLSKLKLPKARTILAKLNNANLFKTDLSKSIFHGALFTGANLVGTNFENANLESSQFIDVITENTNFEKTDLRSTVFSGDFGPNTTLEKANIRGADFRDANMENINLHGTFYNEDTLFPYGFNPTERKLQLLRENIDYKSLSLSFERVKIRYSNFVNNNFEGLNFKRADLKGCRFINCNMKKTNLKRAYARKAEIIDTNISEANLKQVNLDKAYLKNVDLSNANLRGAILTWDTAQNVNLDNATYDQFTVFNRDFNPNKYGMHYQESSLAYYGIK